MSFKIYTFSLNGLNQVGSFHSHIQAFNRALCIENPLYLTYIVERQWCSNTNMIINKNYYVKNKNIYNTDDMEIPIFTNNIEYAKYNAFRMFIKSLFQNIFNIYKYMKLRCPYTDEYLYSYTYKELKNLENSMMKDSNVIKFYNEAKFYFNSIIDIIKLYNIPATQYINQIVRLEPTSLIETLKLTQKEFKKHMLKNSYGASLIDLYPL